MAEQENGPSPEAPQETPAEPVSETSSDGENRGNEPPPPEERPLPEGAVALGEEDDGEIPDSNDTGVQKPARRRSLHLQTLRVDRLIEIEQPRDIVEAMRPVRRDPQFLAPLLLL